MFSLIYIIDLTVLLSSLALFRAIHTYRRRRGFPYPPGPPGRPFIGNVPDLPRTSPWLGYNEASKKYGAAAFSISVSFSEAQVVGPIMFYRTPGQDLVILNSIKAIKDLLEKRGGVYSDRPYMAFLHM